MGEERHIWAYSALEKSCFCLNKSPSQWEGKSPLSHLLSVLQWLNPKQNLTQAIETSSCNCGWTKQMLAMPCAPLEGLQNNPVEFWFSDQKLVLYLPRWGPGALLLGDTHGNKVGWLEGPALLSWLKTGSWDLMFASSGSCWRVPSKVTHQFLLGNEG